MDLWHKGMSRHEFDAAVAADAKRSEAAKQASWRKRERADAQQAALAAQRK